MAFLASKSRWQQGGGDEKEKAFTCPTYGSALTRGAVHRKTWCWIFGTPLAPHSGSDKYLIFIVRGPPGLRAIALSVKAKGLCTRGWAHLDFGFLSPANLTMTSILPQNRTGRRKGGGKEDRREGRREERKGEMKTGKTVALLLIDCKLHVLSPQSPKAASWVPDILQVLNKYYR